MSLSFDIFSVVIRISKITFRFFSIVFSLFYLEFDVV